MSQKLQKSATVLEAEALLDAASPQRPASQPGPAVAESRVTRLAKRESELRQRARKDIDDGRGVLSLSATKKEVPRAFAELLEARKEKRTRTEKADGKKKCPHP